MRSILYLFISLVTLVSCGDDKSTDENVKLDNFKDKISYALGAEQAKMITESGDPNLAKLKFNKIIEGFNEGIKSEDAFDDACKQTIQKLYGPYGQDFDTNYLDAGCICIGKTVGSVFYAGWKKKGALDKIDIELAKIGFQHALEKRDTLIKMEERQKMVNDFVVDINRKNGAKMLDAAKKLPNTQVLPNGIVVQILEAGTGGSPSSSDDVTVDYIVTTPMGDTMDSSYGFMGREKKPLSINLAGVIPGWTQGFPALKKGGKYKMFIPGELAYGAQQGFESLCFYIDFHDFGPAGSLAKPRPQQPVQ